MPLFFSFFRQLPLICSAALLIILLSSSQISAIERQIAQVMWVADGDTLRARYKGKSFMVRLIGIDAPETKENKRLDIQQKKYKKNPAALVSLGKSAKYELEKLVQPGSRIDLEFDQEKYDRYGRLLAYVYLPDGTMLNQHMVKKGYAWTIYVKPNGRHRKLLLASAHQAQVERGPIWR